jgi:Cu(I)/Ag(I) efflux system membrane fusion protein
MHPSVVRDAPDTCPICAMDLVAMAPGTTAAGPLPISQARQRRAGLRSSVIKRRPLGVTSRLAAVVVAEENARTSVPSRLSGWLTKVSVAVNEPIRKGTVLAILESPEATAAAREWMTLQGAGREAAEAGALRLRTMGVPSEEVALMERTGRVPAAWPIRAPQSGVVVRRPETLDAPVEAGDILFELVDDARAFIEASVLPGTPLPSVGDRASFRSDSDPRDRPARIASLAPVTDPITRTRRVRAELTERSIPLRPGETGALALVASSEPVLVAPREAVVETGPAPCVFVVLDGDRFEKRDVVLGARDMAGIAVVDGLGEGERVVTDGNFLVEAETRLRSEYGARP